MWGILGDKFYERIVCKYRRADLAALATDQAYDLSSKHNYNSLCNFFFFFLILGYEYLQINLKQ